MDSCLGVCVHVFIRDGCIQQIPLDPPFPPPGVLSMS